MTKVVFFFVVVAGLLLALGLGLLLLSTVQRLAAGRHTIAVGATLCLALAAGVLIFSLFPESNADGKILGFQFGGAGAFFVAVWIAAMRALKPAERADQLERNVAELTEEIERLQQRIALEIEEDQSGPAVLAESGRIEYRLTGAREYIVGIITGDLFDVRNIDVWVNSENTNMEMSRPTERSISGLIRYFGGRRDDGGQLVDDVIQNELRQRMAGRSSVVPGAVLATGAGELAASHGVRRIVHVGSVEGTPVAGFRQVLDVRRCLTNALAQVDQLNRAGEELRSVVIPLFGTGVARADAKSTAGELANAVVAYLRMSEDSQLTAVYLIAYTTVQRDILCAILDAKPELTAVAGSRP